MASSLSHAAAFDDGCIWPRRLLHIPSMISLPWMPGNYYGCDREPAYIAISYTWGRWKLARGERTDVGALRVGGITWEIPRVNPDHFTVTEFKNVLESAVRLFSEYQDFESPDDPKPTMEYVWIDVACIDQTEGSAEMADEIGRQAKIFKGAAMAFVWLTTLSRQGYLAQFAKNKKAAEERRARAVTSLELKRTKWNIARTEVESVSLDPWFSSLWTLQEAYLCPQAIMMTRDGKFLIVPEESGSNSSTEYPISLTQFVNFCELHLELVVHDQQNPDPDVSNNECLLRLKKALELSGMTGLTWQLPITLFVAAQHRRTSREEDRIYGIMQVFHFRLGKSRPGVDPRRKFKLPELEDELGKELLEREPIMSQMHVFANQPPIGKRWRITETSEKARKLRLVSETMTSGARSPVQTLLPQVQFSTIILDGTMWGTFSGKICAYSKLVGVRNGALVHGDMIVDLDAMSWTNTLNPRPGHQEALDLSHSNPDAVVLLLGIQDDATPYRAAQTRLGLLLTPCPVEATRLSRQDVWQRLGLCEWSPSGMHRNIDSAELYGGRSGDWSICTGVFG